MDGVCFLLQCNTPEILYQELLSPPMCVPAFKGKKAAALGYCCPLKIHITCNPYLRNKRSL